MSFLKYQHLERVETTETEGLLEGECFIFPKIDGTNGSVWWDDDGIQAGSRNRLLTPQGDNAGFCKHVYDNVNLHSFFRKYPQFRLYGEWLVPHTIKNYRDDAWRKFYIFDVVNEVRQTDNPGGYERYDDYKGLLDEFDLDYVPCIGKFTNPKYDLLYFWLEKNTFLMKDGAGQGEGIVIKNYNFVNRYGRTTWGKLVGTAFKEEHIRTMGYPEVGGLGTEEWIVKNFLTEEFVKKEQSKISLAHDGWTSKNIPELLGRVWHEFIREEMTDILKKAKNPKIDFRVLNRLVIQRTKGVIGV